MPTHELKKKDNSTPSESYHFSSIFDAGELEDASLTLAFLAIHVDPLHRIYLVLPQPISIDEDLQRPIQETGNSAYADFLRDVHDNAPISALPPPFLRDIEPNEIAEDLGHLLPLPVEETAIDRR